MLGVDGVEIPGLTTEVVVMVDFKLFSAHEIYMN